MQNIAEFYFECFEKGNSESLIKIDELMKAFPENEKILSLINKNLISKKETLLLKLFLDLKLHFLLNFDKMNLKAINNLIYVTKIFYRFVNNGSLKILYEKLKEDKVLKKFYVDENKMLNFSKKSHYYSELKKIKNDSNDLFGGLDYDKFCL